MIRIAVLGLRGRMGQWVQKLLITEYCDKIQLSHDCLDADALIDFSSPQGVIDFLKTEQVLRAKKLPVLLIGSTGWTDDQLLSLTALSNKTRILRSSNFSVGFHVFLENLKTLAPALSTLGYSAKISETHHLQKKDSPSGSAVLIQATLQPFFSGAVPILSHREGKVVGEHEVYFESLGDRIIFQHSAIDRSIFARGAIEAALWLSAASEPKDGHIISLQAFLDSRT